jgi:hypothetical protein
VVIFPSDPSCHNPTHNTPKAIKKIIKAWVAQDTVFLWLNLNSLAQAGSAKAKKAAGAPK